MPSTQIAANLTSEQKIERASLNQVSLTQDPGDLEQLSKVMGEEARRLRQAGQRYRGHELIKSVADFKARVKSLAAKRAEKTKHRKPSDKAFLLSRFFWNEEDFNIGAERWKFMDHGSTLAVQKSAQLIRYIVSKN